MKKYWIAAAAAAAVLLTAGSTFAFFSDRENKSNEISIGSVTTEIVETYEDPGLPDPGQRISKKVQIRSTGETACRVRVQVLFSDGDMEDLCSVDYNTDDWTYGSDGWWYYGSSLEKGGITEPLFTKITLSEEANDIRAFDVFVRQESREIPGNDVIPWK